MFRKPRELAIVVIDAPRLRRAPVLVRKQLESDVLGFNSTSSGCCVCLLCCCERRRWRRRSTLQCCHRCGESLGCLELHLELRDSVIGQSSRVLNCAPPSASFCSTCRTLAAVCLSPAGQQDQARRRFHARIDRAGHEKAEKNDKDHDRHHRLTHKRTHEPHSYTTPHRYRYYCTQVPCDNCTDCMQHGMRVCRRGR